MRYFIMMPFQLSGDPDLKVGDTMTIARPDGVWMQTLRVATIVQPGDVSDDSKHYMLVSQEVYDAIAQSIGTESAA